jgi:hypothetical protein
VILNQRPQRRKAIGGKVKQVKRTQITIETREVLFVGGQLLEARCTQCGALVDLIHLQDLAAGLNREACRDQTEVAEPHLTEPDDGQRFIRLNSLRK